MVLSAREILLQKVNARVETFLPDRCTISRRANVRNAAGSPTGALEVVAENVPCRVFGGESDISEVGQQLTLSEWYRLAVPVGTDLSVDYVVTLADGNIYQVIEIMTQRTEATDAQALIKREVH